MAADPYFLEMNRFYCLSMEAIFTFAPMPENYLTNPLLFLLNVAVQFYTMLLVLRFLLHWSRADFHNPLSTLVVRFTTPALRPFWRFLPRIAGQDFSPLLLAVLLFFAQKLSLLLVGDYGNPYWVAICLALADLVELLLNVFVVTIIAQAILSWIRPSGMMQLMVMLAGFNEPLLRPVRRLLPNLPGLDLSPLIVLVALQVGKMLLIPPLHTLAAMQVF